MTSRGWLYTQVRVTAVLAAVSALFLVVVPWMDTRDFSDIEALGPVDYETLQQSHAGKEVLVEGLIPKESKSPHHDLVISITHLRQVSTAKKDNGRLKVREMERRTPPFDMQLPGGRIRIENDGYSVTQLPTVTSDGSLFREGIAPGDPVVVIGYVQHSDSDVSLRARTVAYGDRESYVHALKGNRRLNRKIGLFFAGFAALVFVSTSFAAMKQARRREYVRC